MATIARMTVLYEKKAALLRVKEEEDRETTEGMEELDALIAMLWVVIITKEGDQEEDMQLCCPGDQCSGHLYRQ